MIPRWSRWIGWLTVAVVAADWWSKFLILNRIAMHQQVAVVNGWLYLVHLQNRGVAFSILNGSGAIWRTPLLIAAACAAVFLLVRLARASSDARVQLGIALVVGGALGNLGDRIAHGGVTDFLLFPFFPLVFNVADAAITIGGIILALSILATRAEPTPSPGM